MFYIAIIHKDADSDYGVSFPDFPGCITAGSTLDEAKDYAAEALALHIKGALEDGEELPEPSQLEVIAANPDFTDGVGFLVPAPEIAGKVCRVNFTIQESILRQIDTATEAQGLTRSAFLARAAMDALEANHTK